MNCPKMILNLIKYVAFGICILYAVNQNRDMIHYIQKGGMIGGGMVIIEYLIENICRDVRENFTTGPGISDEEGTEEGMTEQPTPMMEMNEDEELDKLIEESMDEEMMENEMVKQVNEEEEMKEGQKIEYGYSFVHPDAMKLPEVRIPKCLQEMECSVCPVMMGGTADLMQVKPVKKPIAGCQ